MTLYEINSELERLIIESIDEETGEINEGVMEELESLQMEWGEKVENIACFIKNLKADAEAIKQEKMNLAKRQAAAENKAERLKNYLSDMMNGRTYKSPRAEIGYRRSVSVHCDDLYQVPDDYLRHKEPELNKTLVADALKKGEEVPGCYLEETRNIQIK